MSAAPLILLAVFIAGVWLGPGQETQVILLADADGSVGAVEVQTRAGSQRLDQPGQMTRVAAADSLPAAPVQLSSAAIERQFAAVLAAEPPPPKIFLLYFEGGSTQLVESSRRLLPEILAEIGRRKLVAIGVYGHSDRVGSDAYNLRLSMEWAMAVRDLLLQAGIKAERIDIDSHGEGYPLIPTADQVAEPRNRRVEVIVR